MDLDDYPKRATAQVNTRIAKQTIMYIDGREKFAAANTLVLTSSEQASMVFISQALDFIQQSFHYRDERVKLEGIGNEFCFRFGPWLSSKIEAHQVTFMASPDGANACLITMFKRHDLKTLIETGTWTRKKNVDPTQDLLH